MASIQEFYAAPPGMKEGSDLEMLGSSWVKWVEEERRVWWEMAFSQGKVISVGWVRTAQSWGTSCGLERTAPGEGRDCGRGSSSHCWGRRLLERPSSPAGKTVLSSCLARPLACWARHRAGTDPDWDSDYDPDQECPAGNADCSSSAPLLMGGCLTNKKTVGLRGMWSPRPLRPPRCQILPHRRTDAPPVPLSRKRVPHFLFWAQTKKTFRSWWV